MRPGGGKAKGSAFERQVCVALSKWVSHGKESDLFWRSAMSGGRATVARRKGVNIRQAGDICSVAPEGHAFTDQWFIECKFYKDLGIAQFLLNAKGPLAAFWETAIEQARLCDRNPLLIVKQNGSPVYVITYPRMMSFFTPWLVRSQTSNCDLSLFDDMLGVSYTKGKTK